MAAVYSDYFTVIGRCALIKTNTRKLHDRVCDKVLYQRCLSSTKGTNTSRKRGTKQISRLRMDTISHYELAHMNNQYPQTELVSYYERVKLLLIRSSQGRHFISCWNLLINVDERYSIIYDRGSIVN